jgi:FAD/FMN-containing dehydrogenase
MGGYTQGGGHGPLDASYGLGADQVLEFEVVTTDGKHRTVSPTQNEDLYWALAGGGAGNWAVVLSVTVRAHRDGPVAGARLGFARANLPQKTYWAAVDAWFKHVAKLDAQGLRGFRSMSRLTRSGFSLDMATLPGATAEELTTALNPFYRSLAKLNVSLTTNEVSQQSNFLTHFKTYNTNNNDTRNMTLGNRLIPRSLVNNPTSLTHLMDAFRTMVEVDNSTSDPILVLLSSNVTHATAGNKPSDNSVLPAWRDSLFSINLVLMSSERAAWDTLSSDLALINTWQDRLRKLTPGGGSYASEATFDNKHWKTDYYGANYDRLLRIKLKYDPGFVLWNQPAVGSDAFKLSEDGRLIAT